MKNIRQILAIAAMEFRFNFRRGATVAITIIIGLLISSAILLTQLDNIRNWAAALNMTPEQAQNWTDSGFTLQEHPLFIKEFAGDVFVAGSILAWMVMLLGPLVLPVATIMVIPTDRSFSVLELLRSIPLTGGRYLAGKILGTLAAVLLTAIGVLAAFLGLTEIILYANTHFWLSASASLYFIKLSLLDGLPLLVWGTIFGILIGVLFRNRLIAFLPGVAAGLVSLTFWIAAFLSPPSGMAVLMDKAEYFLLQNYHSPAMDMETRLAGQAVNLFGVTSSIDFSQVVWMYVTILAFLAILTALARLWLQWKENF